MPDIETTDSAIGSGLEPFASLFREFEAGAPIGIAVPAVDLPASARRFLVTEHGMTLTLERAYADTLRLETLGSYERDARLTRHVLLTLQRSGRSVVTAFIHIHLAHLPLRARRLVLEQKIPLGRILKDCGIAYVSEPQAYFRIAATVLYGRRVLLTGMNGSALAEAVEILL
jgi:chorismate-pyruvate lyase